MKTARRKRHDAATCDAQWNAAQRDFEKLDDTMRALARLVADEHPTARAMAEDIVAGKTRSPMLRQMRVDGSVLEVTTTHWAAHVLVESFYRQAKDAPNYVEMRLMYGSQALVVTVQKADRRTPHELRLKAEAERDAALAKLAGKPRADAAAKGGGR